jgi:hypothetical protein
MVNRGMRLPNFPSGATPAPIPTSQRPGVQYVEDFFIYTLNALALAGGGVNNSNIQIQADSAFKLIKLAMFADIAVAIQTDSSRVLPLATVQIVDTGSGRQLFSEATPFSAIFGQGGLPFILPIPRIFMPRSNIAVTLTNLTAATTYNIRMSFIGTKMFALGEGA